MRPEAPTVVRLTAGRIMSDSWPENLSHPDMLLDQCRRWRAGERRLVEAYCNRWPRLLADPEKLLALIANEARLRQERGETPALLDYLERYPAQADGLRQMFATMRTAQAPDAVPNTPSRPQPAPPPFEAPAEPQRQDRARGPSAPAIPGYEILEHIESGGQGDVYQARHLRLERVVALKVLRANGDEDSQQLARFHREGRLSARLDHPNIVRIYDYSEHEGRLYFSMEFLEGGSLRSRLRREGPLDPRQAAELLATLADAVQHAHDLGIVHRDLKPSNVLFTRDGKPKVADFGLAKQTHTDATKLTQTRTILGTASYMAPEQAAGRGKNATPASDVYALGAILYELLTGRPPFDGDDWLDVIIQVRTLPPVPPRQQRSGVPPALDELCLRCLEKEPARRPPSAAALAAELRRFLAGPTAFGEEKVCFVQDNPPPERSTDEYLAPEASPEINETTDPPPSGEADGASSLPRFTAVSAGDHTVGSASGVLEGGAGAPDLTGENRWTIPGYEILGEVGRGGMGVVYRARQLSLDRIVALKTILRAADVDDQWARLRTEAQTVASLHHPNIVQVYDLSVHAGCHYIVMEYVERGSLQPFLGSKPQPPAEAALLVEQVAGAMALAHQRGVIHRDIKPANILLGNEPHGAQAAGRGSRALLNPCYGVPKITDFGLVRRIWDTAEQEGMILGTPSYMSPEQATGRNQDIGPQADVWSLGATLYEMLAGRPPFQGPSPFDLITQVITDEPAPVRQSQRKVPRVLEAICMKCLQKERSKRYASAAELADDLRRFREGRSTVACPSFWHRIFPWGH
jgi:serine/threonine protein kinase